MSNITSFIQAVNEDLTRADLLTSEPTLELFHPNWSFLTSRHKRLILLKEKEPLRAAPLVVDTEATVQLFYGTMNVLLSDVLPIGYILDIPYLKQLNKYMAVCSPNNTNIDELADKCEPLITTEYLSVYLIDQTVQVIMVKNSHMQNLLFPDKMKRDINN